MDDNPIPKLAPAGWLEALARSETQLAAGQIVSGEEIMRELDESIARLEAGRTDGPKRRTVSRR
jgi:hypothetical protein